jgi:[ribosomal protein S18]-alanine N-acetyltransferase
MLAGRGSHEGPRKRETPQPFRGFLRSSPCEASDRTLAHLPRYSMRTACTADAAALAAIHGVAFPPSETWEEEALGLQLGLPGVFGLIDAAGGMVLARVAGEEAEVLTLAVVPTSRRRGLGGALLDAALREARDRGARAVFLEVSEANQAARGLYAAAGFVEAGRRRRYYADGTDALVLQAALSLCAAAAC